MGGLEGKGEELKGRMKEKLGDATDNPDMEAEGRAEQMSGKVRQAVDEAKDSMRDLSDREVDDRDRTY
jgi:uncharacterized protein YjbJ (UPF0337 family)